jgi:hypothetical protein
LKTESDFVRAGLVDLVNGDLLPGVLVRENKRGHRGGHFIVMYVKALEAAALDPEFGEQSLRMLIYCATKLEMNNQWVMFNQSDLATELRMCRQNVNRAISFLVKKGVLLQGPRTGRGYAYTLNCGLAWKGNTVDRPTIYPPMHLNGKVFSGVQG